MTLFYVYQRMRHWIYSSGFDISFLSHISITSVNCEVQALWIIAINTLTPSYVSYPWYLFFLFIVVSSFILPTVDSIHIVRFCTKKVTTKTDAVGCHIGQWRSSIGTNRSPIPVDCCVNAFLPLFIRMRSFNAILVVLRRMVWNLPPTTIHWACTLIKRPHTIIPVNKPHSYPIWLLCNA